MKTLSNILNETVWKEDYSAMRVIEKYPGKWIHFSYYQKLGVKVRKQHDDPHGIYMYPVDWLLNNEHYRDSQFATDYPYYYILDIKPDAKILNLGTYTEEECRANKILMKLLKKFYPESTNMPFGYELYKRLRRNINMGLHSWFPLFKCFDGIIDTTGAIHSSEPHQAVMFSTQYLTILDHGKNKKVTFENYIAIVQGFMELMDEDNEIHPYHIKDKVIYFTFNFYGEKITGEFHANRGTYDILMIGEDGKTDVVSYSNEMPMKRTIEAMAALAKGQLITR